MFVAAYTIRAYERTHGIHDVLADVARMVLLPDPDNEPALEILRAAGSG